MSKTKYQITIGYKAVVCINIKANDEKEAKEIAIEQFRIAKDRIYKNGVELQDDNYKADGILNMDETWNIL